MENNQKEVMQQCIKHVDEYDQIGFITEVPSLSSWGNLLTLYAHVPLKYWNSI